MPKLAANLTWLFTEHAFLDRFAAAAAAGFTAVEYLFPYDHEPGALADALQRHGLTQALFNCPPGDWDDGDRGLAIDPARRSAFQDGIGRALDYADALGCWKLHCMAGIAPSHVDDETLRETYVENLRFAARAAADRGRTLLIEPINTRDMPGYYLNRAEQAAGIIDAVGRPNLALQFDIYHVAVMDGHDAVAPALETHFAAIGHVQIADAPGRGEPGSGALDWRTILRTLDALGYDGYVGCEYRPSRATSDTLGWAREYLPHR